MQYRKFGNTCVNVSALGFGAMRLPSVSIRGKNVYDYEESARIMMRAYELGVNYFDTAPGYCNFESEAIVGRALKSIRSNIRISTKFYDENDTGRDCRKRIENSLKQLGTDYIDFYHMWGINLDYFQTKLAIPGGALSEAEKAKEEGLIHHISFSFHDKAENLVKIAETGRFETVLAQYNLLDRSNEEALAKAHALGMGTAVMGSVAGGRLGVASEKISSMIPGGACSSPELALRFVFSNPNVCCALSGMSTMEQVEENCRIANKDELLSSEEVDAVNSAMAENQKLADLYCTGCGYCMPCPHGVNIPVCFQLMNYHRVYSLTDYARAEYANIGKLAWMQGKDASHCIGCGECETKCPQKLSIREQLKESDLALH